MTNNTQPQLPEYEPAICVHKLPNGFSSWAFQSEESGSGPNFYHDVSVCVCSQCGTIRVAGFRQGKDGNMNRFTEEINIHCAIAIDAIIKYANYIHGGEVWARSKQDYAALQAKVERYEKERYEMRLAMRMLLKAFMHVELSRDQEKYYKQADAIFKKYHDVTDVLRNEALAGEKEVGDGGN
jgi:hypothetical protein